MPNYEELYNIAKAKYRDAVDERDNVMRKVNDLQNKKKELEVQYGQKEESLKNVRKKLNLVQKALDKCKSIINDGKISDMKKSLADAGEAYKNVISADSNVADIEKIYSDDVGSVERSVNAVKLDLENIIRNIKDEEQNAAGDLNRCKTDLDNVSTELYKSPSKYELDRRVDNYYAEMKFYEKKWLEGE